MSIEKVEESLEKGVKGEIPIEECAMTLADAKKTDIRIFYALVLVYVRLSGWPIPFPRLKYAKALPVLRWPMLWECRSRPPPDATTTSAKF